MPQPATRTRPTVLAVWLIIAGAIGWWAAFSLTMERLHLLDEPRCDRSLRLQPARAVHGKNLESWQGSVFGFPNPILGLTGWVAPSWSASRSSPAPASPAGSGGSSRPASHVAFVFVIWLIGQSIFVLGTLCPWCMVTWVVTIPTFYAVTLHVLRAGIVPAPARHAPRRRQADELGAAARGRQLRDHRDHRPAATGRARIDLLSRGLGTTGTRCRVRARPTRGCPSRARGSAAP